MFTLLRRIADPRTAVSNFDFNVPPKQAWQRLRNKTSLGDEET
jgi:hypothetical protein